MNDDLLARVALLDPIDEAATHADARAVGDTLTARLETMPAPAPARRWVRSRRIQALVAACLAVALVAVALVAIRSPRAGLGTSTEDGWLVAGTLEDVRTAGVTYVMAAQAFVVARPGMAPYALSAISPHSTYGYEESLLFCRPSGTFVEPAHGDKYDITGQYAVGPSPSGMYGVPLRIVDGDVQVDPRTLLPGAERGSAPLVDYALCPATARWSEPGFMDAGGSGNSLSDLTFFHGPGDDVTRGTFVSTLRGTNCGFPIPTWLQLTDPLGSEPANDAAWRYYVADPKGVWADIESSTYSQTDPLPPTAAFTGYRSHLFQLWIDPARADREVWVVRDDPNGGHLVMRWPRVETLPGCTPPGASASAAPPSSVGTWIRVSDLAFDTDRLVITADAPWELTLQNDDRGIPHNVSIYQNADAATPLFRGELVTGPGSITYEIPALPAGRYVFVCDVHPVSEAGTLVVE